MTTCEFTLDLEGLPSPPAIAMSLLEMFNKPDVKVDDLAKVIRLDPALSAKIIAFCNSPLMGLSRKIDSVERAVVLLGMNAVQMIALSFSLVEIKDEENNEIDFDQFWTTSVGVAVACQSIAKYQRLDGELAFLVGLMLNIGEIAIYRSSGNRDKLRQISPEPPVEIGTYVKLETELLGTNRYLVGAQLMEEWQFPSDIVTTLRDLGSQNESERELVQAVRSGFLLASLLINNDLLPEQISRVSEIISQTLNINEEQLDEMFELAQKSWLDYSELLSLDNDWTLKTLRELENAAKFRMTALSVSQAHDQQKTKEENDLLRSAAAKDALTGVFNRGAYEEQGNKALARCKRTYRPFSLIVTDIDHFKSFNDTHGHQVGDLVLKHVASVLENSLRDYDDLYRYGGEEFVVTLPECDYHQAQVVGERLRKMVEDSCIRHNDQELKVTISVGIASTDRPESTSLPELFELADACLYKAKSQGRNCCVATEHSPAS